MRSLNGKILVVLLMLATIPAVPRLGSAEPRNSNALQRNLRVEVPAAVKCITLLGQVRCFNIPTASLLCDLEIMAVFNGVVQNGIVSGTWSDLESSASCDINMVRMFTQVDFTRIGALTPGICSGSGLLQRPPVPCKHVQSPPGSPFSFACSNCNGVWLLHGHFDLIFPTGAAVAHGPGCTGTLTELHCDLYATATLP